MTVAAYTGGIKLPSARLRVRQYAPLLRLCGIKLLECTLRWESTMPKRLLPRVVWGGGTVALRLGELPFSWLTGLSLIQRQVLPGYLPLERALKGPRVLDVDDAIWLSRGGNRVPALTRSCASVICGNRYLADYFGQWNRNVKLLPTPVDTNLIRPSADVFDERKELVIGWTGTSENLVFLYQIEDALAKVLREHRNAKLLVVSDRPPEFKEISGDQLEFVTWSVKAEAEALSRMTIGVMPLTDTPWARGKCSFKMLCYMAAGVPVVVTPVGMNADVLQLGDIGFGATKGSNWTESLDHLLRDRERSFQMGARARQVAVEHFSLETLSARLANYLFEIKGATS